MGGNLESRTGGLRINDCLILAVVCVRSGLKKKKKTKKKHTFLMFAVMC